MVTEGSPGTATLEPGVISAYVHGWRQLWKNFGGLILILIIMWAMSLAVAAISIAPTILALGGYNNTAAIVLFTIIGSIFTYGVQIFVFWPLNYGIWYAFLKTARGDIVIIPDMFAGFKNYWHAVLANFLVNLIVGVGFLFFIVPGIYLSCKLAFVPFLVVDKKMETFKAFEVSWRMTNNYGWKIFLIGLLAIPIFIAGFICLIIGTVISMMWVNTALASLYHAVSIVRPPVAPAVPLTQLYPDT